jgi:hypothetical protein
MLVCMQVAYMAARMIDSGHLHAGEQNGNELRDPVRDYDILEPRHCWSQCIAILSAEVDMLKPQSNLDGIDRLTRVKDASAVLLAIIAPFKGF